jgi:steroid delta-isomerase-like uncharacterized protein
LDPISTAQRFLTAWNADHLQVIDDLAAADIVVDYPHFPEPVRGAEAFKALLAETYRFFPDIRITADEIVSEGERVVVFGTYRGTHRKGALFGVKPSGKRITVSGVSRHRILGGKILEERGVADNFSLFQQLQTDQNNETKHAE